MSVTVGLQSSSAPFRPGVLAGIWMSSPDECKALQRAIEGAIRAGDASERMARWRLELRNMRWRAWVNGWGGWDD